MTTEGMESTGTSPEGKGQSPPPGVKIVEVKFSLTDILEVMRVGLRRAAVFMGLGCNAARREDFNDYQLDHATRIRVLPETVDSATLKQWKDEFYRWIVAGGLRELVDHINVFLDRIYEAAAVLRENRLDAKMHSKFQRAGLEDKVKTLKRRFNLSCRYPEEFVSIGAVRNCFVHRLGAVGREDAGAGGVLVLKWFGFELLVMAAEGTEHPLSLSPEQVFEPIALPNGGTVAARLRIFEQRFALGEKAVLTPHTLHQVIFSTEQMATDYVRRLEEMAQKMGRVEK
ncbi:MAG: hypothetical protein ACREFX_15830 [Opitutaceae bacterium]